MKSSDITSLVNSTTRKWAKQRKAEERRSRHRASREYMYSDRINQSDVAKELFAAAYKKVSDNGRLPAHARQIFYAVRREIESETGRPLDSRRITQVLLPQYINEHQAETRDWRIVYDPRGNLMEPHTETDVPLGTMDVADYLRSIRSHKGSVQVSEQGQCDRLWAATNRRRAMES